MPNNTWWRFAVLIVVMVGIICFLQHTACLNYDKTRIYFTGTDPPLFHGGVSSKCSRDDFRLSTVILYDLNMEPNTTYNCPNLKLPMTGIAPQLCVYPSEKDIYISKAIVNRGVYEGNLVQIFTKVLISNPGMGVIDIGANIGMYTVIAASIGRQVSVIWKLGPCMKNDT